MGKYGQTAVLATKLFCSRQAVSPFDAWNRAASTVFPDSTSSRDKGCPRSTYLGLSEAGVVQGIPAGNYTRATLNKDYALRAVELLRSDPRLADSRARLWERVVREEKRPNGQMDVVISLWESGLVAESC